MVRPLQRRSKIHMEKSEATLEGGPSAPCPFLCRSYSLGSSGFAVGCAVCCDNLGGSGGLHLLLSWGVALHVVAQASGDAVCCKQLPSELIFLFILPSLCQNNKNLLGQTAAFCTGHDLQQQNHGHISTTRRSELAGAAAHVGPDQPCAARAASSADVPGWRIPSPLVVV